MRIARVIAVLLVTAGGAACGETATSPSSTFGSETFSGTLPVKGSSFYSFSVGVAGPVDITLASITSGTPPQPSAVPVGLGFGIPAGEGCGLMTSTTTASGLTAQISSTVNAGIYCVSIYDTGTLAAAANFAIRIFHP